MADSVDAAVRRLLRSSEELRVLLDVEAVPTDAGADDPSSSSSSSSESSEPSSDEEQGDRRVRPSASVPSERRAQRVLAVVTHVDPYGDEQAW